MSTQVAQSHHDLRPEPCICDPRCQVGMDCRDQNWRPWGRPLIFPKVFSNCNNGLSSWGTHWHLFDLQSKQHSPGDSPIFRVSIDGPPLRRPVRKSLWASVCCANVVSTASSSSGVSKNLKGSWMMASRCQSLLTIVDKDLWDIDTNNYKYTCRMDAYIYIIYVCVFMELCMYVWIFYVDK